MRHVSQFKSSHSGCHSHTSPQFVLKTNCSQRLLTPCLQPTKYENLTQVIGMVTWKGDFFLSLVSSNRIRGNLHFTYLSFFTEGPRSRCYRRTAALKAYCPNLWWRWSFFRFSILTEHRWNENWQGKTEVLGEKPVPVPFSPPQIPHGPTPGLRGEMPATNRLSHRRPYTYRICWSDNDCVPYSFCILHTVVLRRKRLTSLRTC
jgi:hypothetical protein